MQRIERMNLSLSRTGLTVQAIGARRLRPRLHDASS
jgi:hypothetical protein